jgi:hypothetical protein
MRVNYRIEVSLEKNYFPADLTNVILQFRVVVVLPLRCLARSVVTQAAGFVGAAP